MNRMQKPPQGVDWVAGNFPDGWLSTEAALWLSNVAKIEFDLFLPKREEEGAIPPRLVSFYLNGVEHSQHELPRGRRQTITLEMPEAEADPSHYVSMLFDGDEGNAGDKRRLACKCAEIRVTPIIRDLPDPDVPDEAHRMACDHIIAVHGQGYFIAGWSVGSSGAPLSIEVRTSKEGKVIGEVLKDAFRYPRPDLVEGLGPEYAGAAQTAGFAAFLPYTEPLDPIRLTAMYGDKRVGTPKSPTMVDSLEPISTVRKILSFPFNQIKGMRGYLDTHIGPVLSKLNFVGSQDVTPKETAFGTAPADPKISVIVPIYGRYDFIEYQLAHFAADPDFQDAIDLIYVIDDPRILFDVQVAAGEYADLFSVPFRVVTYDRNLGYAGANNVGFSQARADHILLLNSDVFPKEAGWATAMLERFLSLPDCGVLGTRLLYADGALQHDGMSLVREEFLEGLWINDHPGKGGPPPVFEAADATVPVPAATAACFLTSRENYALHGGLDEGFIIGDFEDSDFCLAMVSHGKTNYVARDIVLYHLERQSQNLWGDAGWKHQVTLYNCWRHTRKWRKLLPEVAGKW